MRRGPDALLALEDGTVFRGTGFGAEGETFGEAVFNTAMSGYQEVLTDPSYTGQVVTMTYPHQGNYGTNEEDPESAGVHVAGFVVREASRRYSNWRGTQSMVDQLAEVGVVGIQGIDTRKLTLQLRSEGAMRCGVSTVDTDAASLVARVQEQPGMEGADLARTVTTSQPYEAAREVGPTATDVGPVFKVAALDFGMKTNILRLLAAGGCQTTVFPAQTPPADILAGGFDGVFLSNGPGDPAATTYGIDACRAFLGKIPVFGICLGHQLLGLGLGGSTYKMKYGHRGANQPVKNLRGGRVEVTSHNHGFAVDPAGFPGGDGGVAPPLASPFLTPLRGDPPATPARPPRAGSAFGEVELTHWNLNDGTLEGLRCLDVPAISVQYHPESAPGPHDSRYLFHDFRELMAGA